MNGGKTKRKIEHIFRWKFIYRFPMNNNNDEAETEEEEAKKKRNG